jgi:hypothetical protein
MTKASDDIVQNLLETEIDFKRYNPINNLKWSQPGKQWINHTLKYFK